MWSYFRASPWRNKYHLCLYDFCLSFNYSFTHSFIVSSVLSSVRPSVRPYFPPSVRPSVRPFVCSFVVRSFVRPFVCPSVRPFVRPTFFAFVCPFVRSLVHSLINVSLNIHFFELTSCPLTEFGFFHESREEHSRTYSSQDAYNGWNIVMRNITKMNNSFLKIILILRIIYLQHR